MSDYSRIFNFTAKDALPPGDPNKVIKGSEIDQEYNAAQTAINSKFDSTDLDIANGIPQLTAGAKYKSTLLPDPWTAPLILDNNIAFSGKDTGAATRALLTLNASNETILGYAGAVLKNGDGASFVFGSRLLTAGTAISGGGDLSADRTFNLDLNSLTLLGTPAVGDFLPLVDISDSNTQKKVTVQTILDLVPTPSASPIQSAGKTVDESRTSTSQADDADLSGFSLEANSYYRVEMLLQMQSFADDFVYRMQYSGSITEYGLVSRYVDANGSAGTDEVRDLDAIPTTETTHSTSGAPSTQDFIRIEAYIFASTAGTLDFQWRSAAGGSIGFKKGSHMVVTKVA